jgi:hypothetical protein
MNKVVHVNFSGNIAPESDCVVLVECVKEAIDQFGSDQFVQTLASTEQQESLGQLAA